MKLADITDTTIDWSDYQAFRALVFSVRTDEPMKLGHAYEAIAHKRGYRTYAAMRADMREKGLWE